MGSDREHFASYREQTRVKHAIVEKYIVAFFHILKAWNSNLVYIDGFAGRGTYDDVTTTPPTRVDGSPLRALKQIAAHPALAKKVTTVFIEADAKLAEQLAADLELTHKAHPQLRKPQISCGTFASQLEQALDALENAGDKLAPTFLFVDPCGVAGASFSVIERFLKQDRSEVLIFFNLEGVRRILGLGDKMGSTLGELLGSTARAKELPLRVAAHSTPVEREACIVSYYTDLLRGTAANYVTVFRVEKEDRRTTSHYLIHATRHPKGFTIMKDVMWGLGVTGEGAGGLALEQASLAKGGGLFRPKWEAIKTAVMKELMAGPKVVSHFYEHLASQPDNRLSARAYRQALLELEKSGTVEVLDKQGIGMAGKRRAGTLGAEYHVRLVTPPTADLPDVADDGDNDVIPGQCLRCSERTPISAISCFDCGADSSSFDGDEAYEDEGCWYVANGDAGGEDDTPITCDSCGSANIDIDFESMCGYCDHMADAD